MPCSYHISIMALVSISVWHWCLLAYSFDVYQHIVLMSILVEISSIFYFIYVEKKSNSKTIYSYIIYNYCLFTLQTCYQITCQLLSFHLKIDHLIIIKRLKWHVSSWYLILLYALLTAFLFCNPLNYIEIYSDYDYYCFCQCW